MPESNIDTTILVPPDKSPTTIPATTALSASGIKTNQPVTFISVCHTDIGTKKEVNQDALLLTEAQTEQGPILLAVICDGMGGLAQGEVASAIVCTAFNNWFQKTLPSLLSKGITAATLNKSFAALIQEAHEKLLEYSRHYSVALGTTVAALLLTKDNYYTVHVGDTRIYNFSNLAGLTHQLTKDHSLVQLEVDLGKIAPEEALTDNRRNVLLRCVGASEEVEPEFSTGKVSRDSSFMLCSDGFRHQITPQEFWENLNPQAVITAEQMQQTIVQFTELSKVRGEKDNISAIAVRVN